MSVQALLRKDLGWAVAVLSGVIGVLSLIELLRVAIGLNQLEVPDWEKPVWLSYTLGPGLVLTIGA